MLKGEHQVTTSADILCRLRAMQEETEQGRPVAFVMDIWQVAADEIEKLRAALGLIASKNDLSDVANDDLQTQASAAFAALHECELLARSAIDDR